MTERLDCTNCELSPLTGTMCGVVASRTIREMVKIGYDISSDMKSDAELVAAATQHNARVQQLASDECTLRLLQLESTQKGYGSVVY